MDLKKKVFVGLSGGVDSSVSAALLKKAGYDVTGVFIKVWQPDFLPCSWREERRDAMRVAAKLGIPFLTFDLEKEYKREVVDYMIREYKAGRTPNPDVMCNKYVKFGAFFDKAMNMGADFVATGHYARIKDGNLMMAVDIDKDQSYFLWTLGQDILLRTFFPIGGYKKSEVRSLAKKFGLFTSVKKDSQGLCFVGKLDMKEFLSHYIKKKRGNVFDQKGNIIGYHDGAWSLTLGERHGFTVTEKTPGDLPFYVISKDIEKNTVTVGEKLMISNSVSENKIILSNLNWTANTPKIGKLYKMQTRYHSTPSSIVFVYLNKEKAEVLIKKGTEISASGQSAVFYDGKICLGGGIIE